MKHLPKHLQPRWRYLAVGIESWGDVRVTRDAFQRQLWYAGQNLLGDATAADADLSVLRFESVPGAAEAVVRVRRGEVAAARSAIACVSTVDGDPVGVRVRGVSGTIRACTEWTTAEERYLGDTSRNTVQKRVTLDDETTPARLRGRRVDTTPADADRIGATRSEVTED